jgi:hypothetical protein
VISVVVLFSVILLLQKLDIILYCDSKFLPQISQIYVEKGAVTLIRRGGEESPSTLEFGYLTEMVAKVSQGSQSPLSCFSGSRKSCFILIKNYPADSAD